MNSYQKGSIKTSWILPILLFIPVHFVVCTPSAASYEKNAVPTKITPDSTVHTAPSMEETTQGKKLAHEVALVYKNSIEHAWILLKEKPSAKAIQNQIDSLIQSATSQMVELGKKRTKLDKKEQNIFDIILIQEVRSRISKMELRQLSELAKYYLLGEESIHPQRDFRSTHGSLSEQIATISLLTQYAQWDPLKKQDPFEGIRN